MLILFLQICGLLIAYLIGAIPFGYILTLRATGKNVLKEGSGNVGSTNVRRIAGKRISIITQVLDIVKGIVPVALFLLTDEIWQNSFHPYFIYGLALASIIGHDFSVFLFFKGGKGVNTTLGASVLIAPWSVFIAGLTYFIVKKLFRYVSLGSISLALALFISGFIIYGVGPIAYYLLLVSSLIIVLHRKNIQRLLRGEENL